MYLKISYKNCRVGTDTNMQGSNVSYATLCEQEVVSRHIDSTALSDKKLVNYGG